MSTATATAPGVPASRSSADEDPGRLARGEPVDTIDGAPVHRWGQAPAYLQTQTQLGESRLKLADGQQPLAYIRTRKHGDIALYDPAAAVKMRPLSALQRRKMTARRTCQECGEVGERPLHGPCGACRRRAQLAAEERRGRTCTSCRRVSVAQLRWRGHGVPAAPRCEPCWFVVALKVQAREEERARWCRSCPECGAQTATDDEVAAGLAETGSWSPRCCAPCTVVREERRAAAEQRAREAAENAREARRREVASLQEWAAAALADEDVVVLDTETTGLDDEACLVEVAVVTTGGDVLLDTLVNPGVPIPRDASEIHGITDEVVATAPSFGQLLVDLTRVLDGRRVLIYNKSYDVARLHWELTRHYCASGHEDPAASAAAWLKAMTYEDVMVPYSDWVGDWSDYWGNYSWQPLNGGHRALGDCRAVLDRLRSMSARAAAPTN